MLKHWWAKKSLWPWAASACRHTCNGSWASTQLRTDAESVHKSAMDPEPAHTNTQPITNTQPEAMFILEPAPTTLSVLNPVPTALSVLEPVFIDLSILDLIPNLITLSPLLISSSPMNSLVLPRSLALPPPLVCPALWARWFRPGH